jgi:hypothetical protein
MAGQRPSSYLGCYPATLQSDKLRFLGVHTMSRTLCVTVQLTGNYFKKETFNKVNKTHKYIYILYIYIYDITRVIGQGRQAYNSKHS